MGHFTQNLTNGDATENVSGSLQCVGSVLGLYKFTAIYPNVFNYMPEITACWCSVRKPQKPLKSILYVYKL